MKRKIDIESWERKEHFLFFKNFDEPFYNITAEVEVTGGYKKSKELGKSFYLYYLYQSLKAANSIDEFKIRIEGDELYIYDVISASPTVDRADGTFDFSYMEYSEDFNEFHDNAKKAMEEARARTGLDLSHEYENVIHYSTLPWIKFTSVTHPRHFSVRGSIPKITFGKMYDVGEKKFMPVAVQVNHAVTDGYHIGKFFELFQKLMS